MASLDFHWFLPTNGDSRDIVGGGHGVPVGAAGGVRPLTIGYLGQIARSAEQLGFTGALTPTGAWCEDAWISTAMLAEVTERLKFLVAFRPGLVSPTLAAQMASTFQRLSGNRLLLNVVTGGESHEQRGYGDFYNYCLVAEGAVDVAMDMVTHRFNDHIRDGLGRLSAPSARPDLAAATLSGYDEPPRVVASNAPEVDVATVYMADLDVGDGYRACVAVFGTEDPKVTERDAAELIASLG